jgi:hypothetical protein
MGLLLAFTFSGAASRFDLRRQQIIDEANNIGTAYLRLDLLAPEARTVIQRPVSSVCRCEARNLPGHPRHGPGECGARADGPAATGDLDRLNRRGS